MGRDEQTASLRLCGLHSNSKDSTDNSVTPYLKLKEEKQDWGCSSVGEHLSSMCWTLPELNLLLPTPNFKKNKKSHKKESSTTTMASEICGTLSKSLTCEIKLPKEGPERKGSVDEGPTPDLPSIPGTHTVEGEKDAHKLSSDFHGIFPHMGACAHTVI